MNHNIKIREIMLVFVAILACESLYVLIFPFVVVNCSMQTEIEFLMRKNYPLKELNHISYEERKSQDEIKPESKTVQFRYVQNNRELQVGERSISKNYRTLISHPAPDISHLVLPKSVEVIHLESEENPIYDDSFTQKLGKNFLVFFDELWRIKNSTSSTILKNLEFLGYDGEINWVTGKSDLKPTIGKLDIHPVIDTTTRAYLIPHKQLTNYSLKIITPLANLGMAAKHKQQHSTFMSLMNSFLIQLNNKFNKVVKVLTKPSADKLNSTSMASSYLQHAISNQVVKPSLLSASNLFKNVTIPKKKVKRQVLERRFRSTSGDDCNELNEEKTKQCRTTEILVKNNLNNSFPGTLKSIEENCRQISFLLANCWPDQLDSLRIALSSSWNESIQNSTEFHLPPPDDPQSLPNCGVIPQLPGYLLDRVSWMWLNLCMDVKLRHDYVENLRCLSLWSQERAQNVCHDEYRRMRTNLANPFEGSQQHTRIALGNQPAAPVTRSTYQSTLLQKRAVSSNLQSPTSPLVNLSVTGALLKDHDSSTHRELETKTLCCMFDQFLRCVYRQSTRDCGRTGAQFVVNFLSRIGTDDLKYLCNGEIRQTHKIKHHNNGSNSSGGAAAGNQRVVINLHEKAGPFIETNYCMDPRITSNLRLSSSTFVTIDANRFPGNDPNQKLRPLPGKSSSVPPSNDISMFASDPMLAQPNGSSRMINSFYRRLFIPISVVFISLTFHYSPVILLVIPRLICNAAYL